MPTRSRARLRLLLGLLATSIACTPDNVAGNSLAAAGSWSLLSYNGSALPAVALNTPTTKVEVMSGALDLGRDGTYHIVTGYRMTKDGAVSLTSEAGAGYWVDRGGQITLARDGGVKDATAAFAGDRITLVTIAEDGGITTIVYGR